MSLDPLLLELVACPVDKGPLLWFEAHGGLLSSRVISRVRRVRR